MMARSSPDPGILGALEGYLGQEERMVEDAPKRGRRSYRRRAKRRRDRRHREGVAGRGGDAAEPTGIDESLLTPEERAYRTAQRRADEKVELSRSLLRAALITLPLLVFVPIAGVFALIFFGLDVGRRAFRVFYEPRLREHFLQEEVQRRVQSRVHSERRELEGEHLRSLEELSASIAHEIRNPITAAKSLVQQMGEDPGSADREEYARVAVAELERVERSISHLLRFAREEERRVEPFDLADVLESALETFRDRFARSGIELQRDYDVPGRVEGDPEQLRRVVINLVSNAIDALEESPVEGPRVRVTLGGNLAGNEVWLRIADNGAGFDEEARGRLFDPFFTSREEGTGLGLALCRKIVDEHGGSIEASSSPGEGSEFVITLPRAGIR